MKTITLAAAAILALGAATFTPAFAAEGNGPAFGTSATQGRALIGLGDNQILPASGDEAPVQTANSLPRNFEAGTADYTQAQSMNRWVATHNRPRAAVAAR